MSLKLGDLAALESKISAIEVIVGKYTLCITHHTAVWHKLRGDMPMKLQFVFSGPQCVANAIAQFNSLTEEEKK